MAHISVTSDGVRSGEESTLVVSKGVITTSATTKDLLESLVIQGRDHYLTLHKELAKLRLRIPESAVTRDQVVDIVATALARQIDHQSEIAQQILTGIDLCIGKTEVLDMMIERQWSNKLRRLYRRILASILGREK